MSQEDATELDLYGPLTVAAGIALPIASLIGNAFWNHGTTIKVHSHALWLAIGVASVPVAASFLYYWFRPRPALVPPPHWNLKHDSPGTWAVTGLAAAIFLGALLGWVAYVTVVVLTQYVPGSSVRMPAEVIAVERVGGRYRVCDVRADFSAGWEGPLSACVVPRSGPLIGRGSFAAGDNVELTITENFLGAPLVQVAKVQHGT
jgi:hypothetical protein